MHGTTQHYRGDKGNLHSCILIHSHNSHDEGLLTSNQICVSQRKYFEVLVLFHKDFVAGTYSRCSIRSIHPVGQNKVDQSGLILSAFTQQ